MSPYRTNDIPEDATYYCRLCDSHKSYAETMRHPSGVGSISVCQYCIDAFIIKSFDWNELPITKQTINAVSNFIRSQANLILIFDKPPRSNEPILSWKWKTYEAE